MTGGVAVAPLRPEGGNSRRDTTGFWVCAVKVSFTRGCQITETHMVRGNIRGYRSIENVGYV